MHRHVITYNYWQKPTDNIQDRKPTSSMLTCLTIGGCPTSCTAWLTMTCQLVTHFCFVITVTRIVAQMSKITVSTFWITQHITARIGHLRVVVRCCHNRPFMNHQYVQQMSRSDEKALIFPWIQFQLLGVLKELTTCLSVINCLSIFKQSNKHIL